MRRSLSVLVLIGAFLLGGGPVPAWAAPPTNDTYAAAQEVVVPSVTGPVDTTEATVDADDAEVAALCWSGTDAANTIWYRFRPAEDGLVKVDATASDHWVIGAVVTGEPGSFTSLSCFGGSTVVSVDAGTEYFVVLADPTWDGSDGGLVTLDLQTGEAPTGSFAITGASVAKRTGVVTLTGTVTCTEGAFASVYGSLSQRVGRVATISGSFWEWLECTGTQQVWTATVRPYSGKFAGGKATLDYGFYGWNEWGEFQDSGTRTIQLRAK